MEEMGTALVDRGHAIRMVVPHLPGLATGVRAGIEVVSFRYAPSRWETWGHGRSLGGDGRIRTGSLAVTPLAMAAMLATVRRGISRWKPDLVHLHWLLPQGALGPALGGHVPVVVSLHGADVAMAAKSAPLRRIAAAALRRADQLVAASQEMFDSVARLEPDIQGRATVIPHGANADLFGVMDRAVARRTLRAGAGGPLLLAVGRLVAKKGFEDLIRAMALLEVPDVQLFIAGDGPLRPHLESLAGPGSGITFLGQLERRRLATWFAAADLVVIPSRRDPNDLDSGPVVLTEALASGRGVITTPVGMAPDLMRDGENGYLVPEADPSALAAAIARALPEADQLGAGAREAFEASGDWSRVAVALEAVYEAAIAHRRAKD
jgi:glycosyltransferase involved in cell wall biosynthesis